MEAVIDLKINKKTKYRPFKRCFKYPKNTVTKWVFNLINKAQYKKLPKKSNSTSRAGSTTENKRFSSIKGFCKLRRNGQLY